MKTKTIIFITFLWLFLACGSLKTGAYDFTREHLFTSGIEGPAVDSKGILYAVNFSREGTIGMVNKKGDVSLFVTLPEGSIGNGIRFDRNDNMYIADYTKHNVLFIRKGSRHVEVFAHESTANQPNDLAISPSGILYASDPNWKNSTGKLWRVDRNGFHLLEDKMGTTNGIEVSPDGAKLYVNESIQRKIWVYDLDKAGSVSNKRLFYSVKDFGLDGMRCDNKGNLYVCRYGAGKVVILSPDAEVLKEIRLTGQKPTNIAFGGEKGDHCFVTVADRGVIETFKALNPGRNYK